MPADVDPANWSPDATTVARYQRADLIILNGAGYATWTSRATLPTSRLVDTSKSFANRYIYIDEAATHTHGPDGRHAHENLASTTWLDPELARQQARSIRDALAGVRPDLEAEFEAGYATLDSDLAELDREFSALFTQSEMRRFFFSHPVYQYLARRYELDSRSVHWEPEQLLADTDLDALTATLSTHPASIMIWEREPSAQNRQVLDNIGIASIVFETGANTPASGDYLDLMRRNLENLRAAM